MPVNVVMPQMGESVAEGTVVRWIKQVGDAVDRDEPLFEISTDKVDAEIPSPAAGTLTEIMVKEGETVPVDSVVAVIAQAGDAAAAPAAKAAAPAAAASTPQVAARPASGAHSQPNGSAASSPSNETPGDEGAAAEADADGGELALDGAETAAAKPRGELSVDELRRQRSSPLVRKIAQEHNVDISQISGSGVSGRVTKNDILGFLENRKQEPAAAASARPAAAAAPVAARPAPSAPGAPAGPGLHIPAYQPGERVEIQPLSVMRRKIAEHMVYSRRTSAHVHSVFEVDYSRVAKIREAKKAEFERSGAKLTFLSFIAKAVIDALRVTPVLNAALDGDNIVYKKDINVGIAVALEWGLIVPVIKQADEKNLLGLSRSIADLATRARAKQLKPEEVQQGTFTITNPGIFGAQFGMPIINQPQVAILGVGAIEKKAVVVDDAIAIRPRGYLTLGYDHRLVDGAVGDQFMALIKEKIENFDPAGV